MSGKKKKNSANECFCLYFLQPRFFSSLPGMSDLTPPFPSVTSLQSEDICPLAGSPTGAGGVCEPEEDGMGEQN